MRRALLLMHGRAAAVLTEHEDGGCTVEYIPGYSGAPVSLTFAVSQMRKEYADFPPFLNGLLLEGAMLENFLQGHKIDCDDCFAQLVMLGGDLAGALTARELGPDEKPEPAAAGTD